MPLCKALAVGAGALGAWWAWLGVGARVDALLVWAVGGLWAVGLLLPCVWRFVMSGGAWLVCGLRGWCGAWLAWVMPAWWLRLGAGCVCVGCAVHWSGAPGGVVGRDAGFPGVCGRLAVSVAGGVVFHAGGLGRVGVDWACWWWLWLDCLVAAVSVGRPDGGPRVCGGWCACLVVVAGWCGLGLSLLVLLGGVPLGVWFAVAGHSPLRAARGRSRQAVCAGRVLTRPSRRRLFRSRQGLGSLPGAHTSIRTAAVL